MRSMVPLLLLLLCFCGCASVQYTNRKTIILVPPSQEMALGEEAFKQVLSDSKPSTDKRQIELIKKVGEKIAAAAEQPKFKWDFILIEDSGTVNAFCLPGGKVAFFSGILPLCEDETGIAVVMGHEIAHAVARHGAERMSEGMVTNLLGEMLATAVTNKTPEAQKAILNGYGLATNLGVMLPFSRKHEYEADYIGGILMAKAGYDPAAAVDFWKRMMEYSKGKSMPEFLSTHPNDNNRISEIQNKLPQMMKYYKK